MSYSCEVPSERALARAEEEFLSNPAKLTDWLYDECKSTTEAYTGWVPSEPSRLADMLDKLPTPLVLQHARYPRADVALKAMQVIDQRLIDAHRQEIQALALRITQEASEPDSDFDQDSRRDEEHAAWREEDAAA